MADNEKRGGGCGLTGLGFIVGAVLGGMATVSIPGALIGGIAGAVIVWLAVKIIKLVFVLAILAAVLVFLLYRMDLVMMFFDKLMSFL